MPRVTHATKETSRELRSIVIWNFVDLYAAQLILENKPIGLAGVAKNQRCSEHVEPLPPQL
jgi:hypothetical protein